MDQPASLSTYRLTIAYRGTNYHGWQKQDTPTPQATVQEAIEVAVKKLVGTEQKIFFHGSGRTDSGVHARAQVAHLRLPIAQDINLLLRALNAHLPEDIRILKVEEASPDFHAQLDVETKTYRYFIFHTLNHEQKVHWPFLREYSWFITYPLDLAKMEAALKTLEGEHDFKSFQNRGTPVNSTVREIFAAKLLCHRFGQSDFPWLPPPTIPAQLLEFRIEGSGFLKQMVRTIVGTVVEIGRGRLEESAMADILASKDREASGITAPANGLFLDEVKY